MFAIKLGLAPSLYVKKRIFVDRMLALVVVLYGIFSAPFPDEYGLPELIIGLLLIVIIATQLVTFFQHIYRGRYLACLIPFIWLVVVPTVIGALRWEIGDIIRDVVPLFYLFLPMFLITWARKMGGIDFRRSYLVPAMVVAGSGFSLRYFTSQGIGLADLGLGTFLINLKYYSYDPTVTFTAIFGLLFALTLFRTATFLKYPVIVLFIGTSLLAAGSLGGIGQRAPLAILGGSLVIFLIRYSRTSPLSAIFPTVVLMAVGFYFQDIFLSVYSVLSDKTEAVGINGKFEEFELIMSVLLSSWDKLLFGLGWGGTYYNSVVEGQIRFAHSIVGFYLLKTGLIGLSISLIYMLWLVGLYLKVLLYAWRKDVTQLPVIFAVGSALVISLLQPTYKTLGFGLIIALIPAIYFRNSTASRGVID